MYACKLLCVELYTSRNTRSANDLGVKIFPRIYMSLSVQPSRWAYLQHGGVALCSVKCGHCTSWI